MSRTVVTVHALHLIARQLGNGLSGRAIRHEGSRLTGVLISVFHPRNGLTLRIGGCVMNLDSGTKMFPVNAAKISASRQHHQDGLRLRVSLVVLKMKNYTQLYRVEHLGPVAPFASYASRDQAVAFHGRFNRVMNAFKNRVNKLPGAALFTLQPTGGARSNVALHAINSRVCRVLMGDEFRFHYVTALPAELWRFHVLNSAVGALRPDDDV